MRPQIGYKDGLCYVSIENAIGFLSRRNAGAILLMELLVVVSYYEARFADNYDVIKRRAIEVVALYKCFWYWVVPDMAIECWAQI